MAKTAVAVAAEVTATPGASEVRGKAKPTYNPNTVADVYLKTNNGVTMLIRREGDEIREKIEHDTVHSPLDYRFFDDDKKRWAYWAVKNGDGTIRPPTFPNPNQYTLTSLQLYTKAVTYPHILAHAVGLLKDKPATLWDKMLKPTTIIIAIVGIVFVMGLMLMALTG
jgi:hypothetical protein